MKMSEILRDPSFGRTGRLILSLFLMQNGYPPVNVKFADRRRYYDCFDSFYRDGNAAPMIEMVAEYVEERLRWYLVRIISINNVVLCTTIL